MQSSASTRWRVGYSFTFFTIAKDGKWRVGFTAKVRGERLTSRVLQEDLYAERTDLRLRRLLLFHLGGITRSASWN
ncbi:MAG: hypothetical protein MZV63_34585 [Marinilabiliales bacterium]|nr:hypothetical protein [Marinilabiliales bacterium]